MKTLNILIASLLTFLIMTSCEQEMTYRTYENGRLPYLLDVPDTWEMDESSPVLIKFLNAEHTISISCEIGEHTLIPDRYFNAFYEFLYEEHKDAIYDPQALLKTDSLYIMNWKANDSTYVFDGSKPMNGYLCGIQVTSTSTTLSEGIDIFQHVFESIRPNPNFIAPITQEDDELMDFYED